MAFLVQTGLVKIKTVINEEVLKLFMIMVVVLNIL